MIFRNRQEAGRSLAWRLRGYAGRHEVVVLGVPRGGIPVAFEIAEALRAPLDVFIVRKLGIPGQEEVALGAIASGGVRILDQRILRALSIQPSDLERILEEAERELNRREVTYRGSMVSLPVRASSRGFMPYGNCGRPE
jgi:putative phosphoribosyl transferase